MIFFRQLSFDGLFLTRIDGGGCHSRRATCLSRWVHRIHVIDIWAAAHSAQLLKRGMFVLVMMMHMLMFDFLFQLFVRWDNLLNGWRRLWHFQILLLNDLFLFDNWRFVMMMHFSNNGTDWWWWRLWHFMFRFMLLWCRHFVWDVNHDTTFTVMHTHKKWWVVLKSD